MKRILTAIALVCLLSHFSPSEARVLKSFHMGPGDTDGSECCGEVQPIAYQETAGAAYTEERYYDPPPCPYCIECNYENWCPYCGYCPLYDDFDIYVDHYHDHTFWAGKMESSWMHELEH